MIQPTSLTEGLNTPAHLVDHFLVIEGRQVVIRLRDVGPCAGENDSQRGNEPPLLQPSATTGGCVGGARLEPAVACVEEINSNPEGLWVHPMWRVLTATRPLNCGNPHGEFAAELSGMLQSPQRAATCRCGKLLWRGCLYLCNFL